MDKQTERLLFHELTKFFKSEKEFTSLDEIKQLYGISDTNLNLIVKVIRNRIDPVGWINENIKISHPNLGIIPFKTYDFQNNVVKLWITKHFLITLKSRQIGLSTITEAICLWCALNYQKYTILILSAKDDSAKEFLSDINEMYCNMTIDETVPKIVTDNEHTLEFDNGSKILARPATEGSTRGLSINLMIIDEAASIPHIDDVYQAAYPVISRAFPKKDNPNDKPYGVIIISTPKGLSGRGRWFYDMYSGAVSGRNNYCPIRIHWKDVPEFDNQWYYNMCENFNWDDKKIASELDLSFISSGDTFIPNAILDRIQVTNPIMKDISGKLWLWEQPNKNDMYVMGVDVAYGDKKDSSVIQVIKSSTLEQVAEFESNSVTIPQFEKIVYDVCTRFPNHIINIERNAVGKSLIDLLLKDYPYANIHYYKDINPGDLRTKPGQHKSPNDNIGTTVTGSNRDLLLSNMYQIVLSKYIEGLDDIISEEDPEYEENKKRKFEAIMNVGKEDVGNKSSIQKKLGIIKSERLLNQLLTFVIDSKGRASGAHDDLVMAWTHALYCYTKNKPLLLSGVFNTMDNLNKFIEVPDTVRRNMEFMKKYNAESPIWKNIDQEAYEKELTEQYTNKLKEDMNIKLNSEDDNTTVDALRALYNF